MDDWETIHRAIASLYDAAVDPDAWPDALVAVADAVGAVAASLYATDPRTSDVLLMKSWNHDPQQDREFIEHYTRICPRTALCAERGLTVMYDYLHTQEEQIGRDEYSAWHLRYGHRYYIGGAAENADDLFIGMALQRSPAQGHVQRREIETWSRLVPHVRRAVRMARRLQNLEVRSTASAEVIERYGFGVVLLGADGAVLLMNRAAREAVAAGDGLGATGRGLFAERPGDDAVLQRLIDGAVETALGRALGGGGSMALPRRSGRRAFGLQVMPMPQDDGLPFASERPAAVVIITDPEREVRLPLDLLRLQFGLTGREAQLAGRLATGESLDDVAEALGMAVGTARLHLSHVLRKTRTRRQGELVALLGRLAH